MEQIRAIKTQSCKPKEIWLFQDAIPKDYVIIIKDSILSQFDRVYIAEENKGVWGRFDFARKVNTKYVCIFDDDTLPGKRWLENCIIQMSIKEAVYGTIGVIFTDPKNYTKGGHFRIGWHRPNNVAREVDLVGHSWFLKREWLEYMFTDTFKFSKKYKYAAEDMSLSYACQKHGISTLVPPHPIDNMEMWGSIPSNALKIGLSPVALSLGENNIVMNQAADDLVRDGWIILKDRDTEYVKARWKDEKRYRWFLRRRNLEKKFSRVIKSEL